MKLKKDVEIFGKGRITRVKPDADTGLSLEQVAERVANGWDNKPVASPTKTVGQIIKDNVVTYFNIIFFAIAAALILVGSFNNLSFMIIIIVNLLIGIVQEINSKRILDSLRLISEPKIKVIRDSAETSIMTENLVVDDVVIFASGMQICADATLLTGELQVNESLITGESDEIAKKPGDRLLSGSYVVSGSGRARLDAVGEDSFVSKLTLDAKKAKKSSVHGMMYSLTKLIQIIGILIIPLGIGLMLTQHYNLGLGMKANVEKTAGAIIGMIPEGLYLLVNVTLAVSVSKLARKDTLVHDLGCIETLARVDTLCVDKTGTITDNSMKVDGVVPLRSGIDPVMIMRDFVSNMSDDNITMKAMKQHFGPGTRRAVNVIPFSSITKTSAVSFSETEHYILGAPEFVLKNQYQLYRATIDPYVMNGKRVLILVQATNPYNDDISKLTPLALVLLTNPVRPEAPDTFRYFAKQGVDIKVISGDNPLTVAAAAREAGIEGSEKCIDLTGLSDERVTAAASEYTVFGRVNPEQKRILVRALKAKGHTVAMTGDGVNDILALKEADCSIAMASGSDVTCQVSHLVLLKSKFSSLPSVVAEGRQVINNIERSAALFLVKNIFSFVLAIISIFAAFEYPLQPVQISLISGLTIGIPSFVLALEKNENRVHGKFLLNVIYSALPAALTDLIVVIGVILFADAFRMDTAVSSSVITILMGLVGFTMIFKLCRPFNKQRTVLITGLGVLFIAALLIMPGFFEITPPDYGGWLVLAVFTLLIPSVIYSMSNG
ncbi:MAG: HAD-IC family P-type ATPase, partial [Clostridia bacterium]|nr:HAD-IC family P-type ATPase [Clostridia bacterium]